MKDAQVLLHNTNRPVQSDFQYNRAEQNFVIMMVTNGYKYEIT